MFIACALALGLAPAPDPVVPKRLPTVVLVGDSIRQGYQRRVQTRLAGKAHVVGGPDNAGDSRNLLAHLDDWAIQFRPDVVHFNSGLHDIKSNPVTGIRQVELEEYRDNLRAIIHQLGSQTSARLILATSTPVIDARRKGSTLDFTLAESDVRLYNQAAMEVAAEAGYVRVDDLHDFVDAIGPERAINPDGLHFSEAGNQALAERVADAVEAALAEPEATLKASCRRANQPPKLDGRLDDPAWATAEVIDKFPAFWAGTPSTGSTRARLLWDDNYLYIAASMTDSELRSAGVRRNDRLWFGDVFEMFFRPDETKPAYYEFQVNPRSVVFEIPFPEAGADFAALAALPPLGLEAVATVDGTLDRPGDVDRSWTVEARIPWTGFARTGGRPAPGATWRFALCRYDYGPDGTKPTLTSSAPLRRPSFHKLEDYGRLTFEP